MLENHVAVSETMVDHGRYVLHDAFLLYHGFRHCSMPDLFRNVTHKQKDVSYNRQPCASVSDAGGPHGMRAARRAPFTPWSQALLDAWYPSQTP